ncbi:helix-turn-helix domain-containing protein [Nocardiopsis alba]|uniref:helix-turn-helix domain-containing protein n=1 Tax=Nocardiopsis alba TaxID=53437 RepID=UPI0033B3C082
MELVENFALPRLSKEALAWKGYNRVGENCLAGVHCGSAQVEDGGILVKRKVRPHAERWGTELKKFRARTGATQAQLADHLHVTDGLISGFEKGTHWPSADKVVKIDAFLEANNALWDLWESLTNGQAYPRWLSGLVDAEKAATRIRTYEPLVVPGLVQTKQYATALVRASNPLASPEKVSETVSGRLKRQELWDGPEPPQMLSVINESVLLTPTGGAEVMVGQLKRLIELVESHRLGVQIIPMSTRFHPGSTGSFVLMSFLDRPDALYLEDAFTGRIVHEEGTLGQAQELFGYLQSAALSLDMSLKRLNEVKRGYEDGSLDVA